MDHKTIFTKIYEECEWGDDKNPEYHGSSGDGSSLTVNELGYSQFVIDFIRRNEIKTIVDIGCGDFLCGSRIYDTLENIQYFGFDAYEKLITHHKNHYAAPKYNFQHLDVFADREALPPADLYIMKDILQHWCLEDIYTFMDYIVESKKYKYIILVNCCLQKSDDTDIPTGSGRPLSSQLYPLKKYKPLKIFNYFTKEVSIIVRD